MADITITPASFVPSANATLVRGVWGATITRGTVVYKNSSNVWVKAQANAAGTAAATGIAATDGAAGQPGLILTADPALALGATVAEGIILALSAAAAGGVCPVTDIDTGEWLVAFGVMLTGNVAKINFPYALTTESALP